jgi:fatty acid desaturase
MNKYKHKNYKFSESIKEKIELLTKIDNWHGILAVLEDYFFIGSSIFVTSYITWNFYPLAVLIIGARQRALATLLHEAAHGILLKNKSFNFALGSFFSGYLIFQTFTSYQKSHVRYHHGHFGDPELDVDYKFMLNEGLYREDVSPGKFVLQNIYLPLFLSKVPKYLYSLVRQRFWETARKEKFIMLCYLLAIALSSIYGHFWNLVIIFWLIPYLTTFQIIGWFIELSEHYPLMKNDCNLYMTRNRNSHWLETFFTSIHNENYHLVHHLNPTIPFWNQAKAHQIYLQDENYARHDKSNGGIFISLNNADSVIKSILSR